MGKPKKKHKKAKQLPLYKRFLQSKEKRVHKVQYLQDKNTLVYLG